MEQIKDISSEWRVGIGRNDIGKTEGACKEQLLHPKSSCLTGYVSTFLTEKFQDVFFKSSQLLFSPCAWVSGKYLCLFSCLSYSALFPILFRKNATVSVTNRN